MPQKKTVLRSPYNKRGSRRTCLEQPEEQPEQLEESRSTRSRSWCFSVRPILLWVLCILLIFNGLAMEFYNLQTVWARSSWDSVWLTYGNNATRCNTIQGQQKEPRQNPLYNDFANYIPLPDLVRAHDRLQEEACTDGLFPAPQTIRQLQPSSLQPEERRKIPKIVHQTGESQCLTKPFFDNCEDWTFEGYSFVFHDSQCRKRLLNKFWPEFPHLQVAFKCLQNAGGGTCMKKLKDCFLVCLRIGVLSFTFSLESKVLTFCYDERICDSTPALATSPQLLIPTAAISDLWRYLVLWEYGGIYVDMDTAPGVGMNATTIPPDMDALLLKTRQGWNGLLSQYFMAMSPKHPLMFLAVYDVLEGMLNLDDVGNFPIPQTTGPDALARAYVKFRQYPTKEIRGNAEPAPGTYVGMYNRSVTVWGNEHDWVHSDFIKREKNPGRK